MIGLSLMTNCFKNKKAIVTGVASGIGFQQANLLLQNGCDVVGIDINTSSALHDFAKFGNHFQFVQADLADDQLAVTAVNKALCFLKTCDFVCNTAGILDDYKPLLATDFALWDKIIKTNLYSLFAVTKTVLPLMLKQQHGVFVNMASIAGMKAGGGGAAYTSSKHAIIGFTKQLDFDYASQGIRANCIAPGAVKTAMTSADFAGDGAIAKQVAQQIPVKRYALPEEIADATLYLLSDRASYIHGTVLTIDGGWMDGK